MTDGKDLIVNAHATTPTPQPATARGAPPPSKHQLALMIWLCVFPTLTGLNLVLGGWLADFSPVLRTFVLATVAVPIVIYGLMPHLHRFRARLLATRSTGRE
jgi:antibiotic biosynthesis monooxygenase (ABM) superfamily enzyme